MLLLTELDCQQVVQHTTHTIDKPIHEILNFQIENFGNYFGFLGEYYRLKIDIKLTAEEEQRKDDDHEKVHELFYFVKTLPTNNEERRDMLLQTGIFAKEVRIFRDIIPLLLEKLSDEPDNCWCPNAHLIRDDLLIFNDLSHEGYQMLPFRFEFSREHVETTLTTLARFHTCSIAYEQRGNSIAANFGDILFETSIADIPWYHSGLKAIATVAREKCRTRGGSQVAVIDDESFFYGKLLESIEMMEHTPLANFPSVLTHRDVWKNNLMFKLNHLNQPQHCVLVDFQTARYLPISIDVLMAIICTVSRDTREKYFDHFLLFYYHQLDENTKSRSVDLKSLMSFDDFQLVCRFHRRVLLIYRCILLMITMIPDEELTKLTKDEIRQFGEVDKSEIVLKIMKNDVDYETKLVEAVNDVVECLIE